MVINEVGSVFYFDFFLVPMFLFLYFYYRQCDELQKLPVPLLYVHAGTVLYIEQTVFRMDYGFFNLGILTF